MVAENSQRQNSQAHEVWERLEKARRAKAAEGDYAGYGSSAFGHRSIGGKLIENPDEQQIIELIRRYHKSGNPFSKWQIGSTKMATLLTWVAVATHFRQACTRSSLWANAQTLRDRATKRR